MYITLPIDFLWLEIILIFPIPINSPTGDCVGVASTYRTGVVLSHKFASNKGRNEFDSNSLKNA